MHVTRVIPQKHDTSTSKHSQTFTEIKIIIVSHNQVVQTSKHLNDTPTQMQCTFNRNKRLVKGKKIVDECIMHTGPAKVFLYARSQLGLRIITLITSQDGTLKDIMENLRETFPFPNK